MCPCTRLPYSSWNLQMDVFTAIVPCPRRQMFHRFNTHTSLLFSMPKVPGCPTTSGHISPYAISGCVSIQGLHPSKDPAFAGFEGESFRKTCEDRDNRCWIGRSSLRSISWLRHQIFPPLPHVTRRVQEANSRSRSAAQCCLNRDACWLKCVHDDLDGSGFCAASDVTWP